MPCSCVFVCEAEDGIRDLVRSRGLGDVYKRQNRLRLIKLPKAVQDMLMGGGLDMGHARALLALDGARLIAAANKIAADGLSVREAEKLVQDLLNPIPRHNRVKPSRDTLQLQEDIAQNLGTNVQIKEGKKGAGKLIINYTSHDHLAELIARWK